MTTNKSRPQCKCRVWERDRRNRLSQAFTALANVLPSGVDENGVPLPSTKLFILQMAVKHIKELQQKNEKIDGKACESNSALLEKLSILEERCSKLIQQMQKAGLTVNPMIAPVTNASLSTPIHDIINVINKDDEGKETSKKSDVEESPEINCVSTSSSTSKSNNNEISLNPSDCKESSKNIRKSKRKYKSKKKPKNNTAACCNSNNVPHHSAVMQKNNTVNNVWVTPNNQNGPLMFGNTILPFMPIASPVLMASTPQAQTFFLVQRPSLTNSNNVINIPTMKHPIPAQKSQKMFSNVNGFEVTKTTMVNKVPISAFSSTTLSKAKNGVKSVKPMRVTQRSRNLFLNSQKTRPTPTPKNNKENISSVKKNNNKEDVNIPVVDKPENLDNDSIATQNIEKNNCKHQMTDIIATTPQIKPTEPKENILPETINTDSVIIESKENKIDDKHIENTEKIDTVKNNQISQNDNDPTKSCNPKSPIKSIPEMEKMDSKDNSENINITPPTNFTHINQNLINESRETECKLTTLKGSNVISGTDIPEDLLDSFDAPPEQTMPNSPLVSSPLATSPTAAFLLAFPLVCPGPRPDTPLNDNLQTPNICALDNFTTFFSSKESCSNNILNSHSQIFSDCFLKHSPEKMKHNWSHILNTQNSLKPLTEVKYPVKYDMKHLDCHKITDLDKVTDEKLPISTSTACVYSDTQNIFQNAKSNIISHYGTQENIYNYDNLPLLNSTKVNTIKDVNTINDKPQLNFGTTLQNNNITKDKLQNMNNNVTNFLENTPTTITCRNPGIMPLNTNESVNCKKSQTSDNSMKLVLPGVIPEIPSSKIAEVSFGIQPKSTLHNSSNIYTSCNTYNPFSSDFSSNSMNLSLTCANSLQRTKNSTTYFPEFNTSNIYSQNCNAWTDDNQNDFDSTKIDYNRKLNLNQSDYQSDLRFTFPVISKSTNKPVSTDTKTIKNKQFVKELKYTDPKNKTDFVNQKGPVNWMTSDVTVQNNDFFPNYKDIKLEQNLALPNSGQTCVDSAIGKKSDLTDQPFYHIPPSSYVSQVTEDNQFTWSPSKLNSYNDNLSLAPCTLPTLVGDLALGIATETKLAYNLDQESAKERKILQQKTVKNCPQNVEMNSATGHFLSVSQLMERGKITNIDNTTSCKSIVQENKRNITEDRNYNSQINSTNKTYDTISHCGSLPIFPPDTYLNQQHIDNVPKDTQIDANIKNVNKNNYSTESLLQNNPNYQNSRKYKQNFNMQRIYGDNTNYPITNQFIPSNHHPLQFENFSQNQQYPSNAFPYTNPSATMNTSFYSSSNFITSTNTMGTTNYISSGFSSDVAEFPTNENIFFSSKIDNKKLQTNDFTDATKYTQNAKMTTSSKDAIMKTKSDTCLKKDSTAPPSKRQKKHKNAYTNNYAIPERCFNAAPNQINSPMGMDESYFGYAPSQMHSYPSQSALLPNIQLPGTQKNVFSAAKPNMSSPPNAAGNSLTNFNLSAIFPEINKRTNMTGFNEPQHIPSSLTKTLPSGLYH